MAHMREFDTHRGHIIAIWAGLETSLDLANLYGWQLTKGKIAPEVPVSLGRKMELFKRVHRLDELAPIRELGMEVHLAMNELYEDRHWLAHGALLPEYCTPEGWRLLKNEFPKKKDGGDGGLVTHWRFFTHAEMFDLGSRSRVRGEGRTVLPRPPRPDLQAPGGRQGMLSRRRADRPIAPLQQEAPQRR